MSASGTSLIPFTVCHARSFKGCVQQNRRATHGLRTKVHKIDHSVAIGVDFCNHVFNLGRRWDLTHELNTDLAQNDQQQMYLGTY